jgi:hypothetical protein
MKILFIICFVVYSNIIHAQFPLEDKIDSDIKNLNLSKNDAVILFRPTVFNFMDIMDSLRGIGTVNIYELEYLLIKKGDKISAKNMLEIVLRIAAIR